MEEHQKKDALFRHLRVIPARTRTIIFAETKAEVDELVGQLRREGFRAVGIHGDKKQSERDWVLNEFRTGGCSIMVATGVASRGLDIKDIKFVINYTFPKDIESYIHRIGRTGRKTNEGYNEGTAISFFTTASSSLAGKLVDILREAEQDIPPELLALVRTSHHGGGGGRGGYSRFGGGGGRGGGRFGGGYRGSGSNAVPLGGGRY